MEVGLKRSWGMDMNEVCNTSLMIEDVKKVLHRVQVSCRCYAIVVSSIYHLTLFVVVQMSTSHRSAICSFNLPTV